MKLCSVIMLTIWILLVGCTTNKQTDTVAARYYYESECGACKEDEQFSAFWNQCASGIDSSKLSLQCINLFSSDGKAFEQDCARLQLDSDKVVLPLLVLEGLYLEGYTQINTFTALYQREATQAEDSGQLWYFYRPECGDCTEIQPFMEQLSNDRSAVLFRYIDTTPAYEKEAFKRLLRHRGIAEARWQVPFVFYCGEEYSGIKEIREIELE